jgi:hypothetical protein
MRVGKLAIATAAVACAAAVAVTIWKRGGSSPAQRFDHGANEHGADELDKFWTAEHAPEPEPTR